jgi:hypothetical protein
MDQPFNFHPLTDTHFGQQIHRSLLQHASSNALLYILPTAILDYDGVKPVQIQEVR